MNYVVTWQQESARYYFGSMTREESVFHHNLEKARRFSFIADACGAVADLKWFFPRECYAIVAVV